MRNHLSTEMSLSEVTDFTGSLGCQGMALALYTLAPRVTDRTEQGRQAVRVRE